MKPTLTPPANNPPRKVRVLSRRQSEAYRLCCLPDKTAADALQVSISEFRKLLYQTMRKHNVTTRRELVFQLGFADGKASRDTGTFATLVRPRGKA
jgi:DNA-binding CsgD family transcriptional regulator